MSDLDEMAQLLGGRYYPAQRMPGEGPVPRRGENPAFDRLCDEATEGELDSDPETLREIRRALWATWRTGAPTGREMPQGPSVEEDEDAEVARALAESARVSRTGSRAQSPIVLADDEDEELMRAIRMSEQEARAPKRPRRESTPEEERRMLAEAMAASLVEQQSDEVIQELSDDEDLNKANEAFRASREAFRAEEMRRREAERTGAAEMTAAPTAAAASTSREGAESGARAAESSKSAPLSPMPKSGLGAALGDRAQMEKERLARQAARQAGQSGQAGPSGTSSAAAVTASSHSVPTPSDRSRVATLSDFRPQNINPSRSAYSGRTLEGGPATETPSSSTPNITADHPLQTDSPGRDAAGEYYLDGELRHTDMTIGEPTNERAFTPEQVVGKKNQISLIIMSSFVVQEDWLQSILPPPHLAPRIVIRPHPKEQHPAWNGKLQPQDDGEVRCFPSMVGDWGSAHMKYFWIFYRTGRLRVAIMTANMVSYDWEWIENTIFVQDFLPHRGQAAETLPPLTDDFPLQFRNLFTHLKVHKALQFIIDHHQLGSQVPLSPANGFASMAKWDWSRVRVKLVMSVPGTYTGIQEMDKFGMSRLGKVLNESGWRAKTGEMVKAEYQGSSLGAYGIDWMDTFYQFCCGKTTQSLIGKAKPTQFPPIKVVFPSLATVDASELGREGGQTMFCGKAYNAATKHLFHDANSKRGGVLIHSKVLIALFEPRANALGLVNNRTDDEAAPSGSGKRKASEMEDENEGVGGWVYVGSHNFSNAAWGTVNLKKSPPTLTIRNYELGIVFPLPRNNANRAGDAVAPHQRPPRRYSATDVPWDQTAHLNANAAR